MKLLQNTFSTDTPILLFKVLKGWMFVCLKGQNPIDIMEYFFVKLPKNLEMTLVKSFFNNCATISRSYPTLRISTLYL